MKYLRPAYRDRLGRLSDAELLAYARRKYGNPYLTLVAAKEMHKIQHQYLHLGVAAAQRQVEVRAERRRQLRARLWPANPSEAQ